MGTNFVGEDGTALVGVVSLLEVVETRANVGVLFSVVDECCADVVDLTGVFAVLPTSSETESGERDDADEGGDGEGVYALVAGSAAVENRGGLARPRLIISDELSLPESLN
jgi:hypothetical protein